MVRWFRILNEPKIRGHENAQEVLPTWREVQQLFARYFPGDDAKRSDIKRGRDKRIQCTGEALIKQAGGKRAASPRLLRLKKSVSRCLACVLALCC